MATDVTQEFAGKGRGVHILHKQHIRRLCESPGLCYADPFQSGFVHFSYFWFGLQFLKLLSPSSLRLFSELTHGVECNVMTQPWSHTYLGRHSQQKSIVYVYYDEK